MDDETDADIHIDIADVIRRSTAHCRAVAAECLRLNRPDVIDHALATGMLVEHIGSYIARTGQSPAATAGKSSGFDAAAAFERQIPAGVAPAAAARPAAPRGLRDLAWPESRGHAQTV